jgi:general secretion pathway protein M
MLQMQAQAKGLQAQPALDHNATLQTLQTTLSSTLGPTARLQVVGDQAVVTLADASPQALGQWLSQARINARSAPTQAKLTRTDKAPGASAQWSGTLHMALPAKP